MLHAQTGAEKHACSGKAWPLRTPAIMIQLGASFTILLITGHFLNGFQAACLLRLQGSHGRIRLLSIRKPLHVWTQLREDVLQEHTRKL